MPCSCVFKCDANLPWRGVDTAVKIFLVRKLDGAGGPQASSYQSHWLNNLCNNNPEILGCVDSQLCVRVGFLVDCWKRSKDWFTIRQKIVGMADDVASDDEDVPCCDDPMLMSSSFATNLQSRSVEPALKRPATTTTKTKKSSNSASTSTKEAAHTDPLSPPPIKRETTKTTTMTISTTAPDSAVLSPFRVIRQAVASAVRTHEEKYEADFNNEDQHGEYIVTFCSEEEVGKKVASCVIIIRPNTHPDDIKVLKATVSDQSIHIVRPAKSKAYLQHSSKWLALLEKNKGPLKANRLMNSLKTVVTKLKRRDRTKTTHIDFRAHNFHLSNEHFNDGAAERELKMIPLPFTYDMNIGQEKRTITETVCVWRAYIQDTLTDVEDEQTQDTDSYDLMLKMMNGASI
jgi:hypothetical protein